MHRLRHLLGPLLLLPALACAAPELNYAKRFPAQWLERDGQIRLDTVCYNYPQTSYMYRLCRQEAVNTFTNRCQRYRAVHQQHPDDDHYRALADKYCRAAADYRPLPPAGDDQ